MSADLIVQFIVQQWILVAALLGTLTLLVLHESRKAGPAVSITGAIQLVNDSGGVFLDTREASDFSRGHIANAINIPLNGLKDRIIELEKFRSKPVVVVCKMGQSAGSATKILKSEGFSDARKLSGGMIEWDSQKLPTVIE